MIEIGSRTHTLPPPPHVVHESLADPRRPQARPWLDLVDGEVEPTVLVSEAPHRVVWSTLWADRPDDEIHFDVEPRGAQTRLRATHLSPDPMPDEERTRALRHRLAFVLGSDLRLSYDN